MMTPPFVKGLLFSLALSVPALSAQELVVRGNTLPASGRKLRPGHYLTCWGGEERHLRRDPPFHRDTPEEIVAAYQPEFSGSYQFEVKDTWEEMVTRFGSSCFQCGETCMGKDCSCNSCSWQELETFYSPWSTQTVRWRVRWAQDPAYRRRRQEWLRQGQPPVSRSAADLDQLFLFDPERPLEYFLFPGESELVRVSNTSGLRSVEVRAEVLHARHAYHVDYAQPMRFACDDRDLDIDATLHATRRLVTRSPNSIEFRGGWLSPEPGTANEISSEPGQVTVTDVSAARYEGQNIVDHYKDTRVAVYLVELGRFLWWFDTQVGARAQLTDNLSRLEWEESADGPPVASFTFSGSDLLLTRFRQLPFHLRPQQSYSVCARVQRLNNIYYRTKFLGFDLWSEPNCAMFTYKVSAEEDRRSSARRVRDGFARFIGFGVL